MKTCDEEVLLKLEPGASYVIECDKKLSSDDIKRLQRYVSKFGERNNNRFLILDTGFRIARSYKDDEV